MKERLEIALTLTIAGKAYLVPGGNVQALNLRLTTYGVSGNAEFFLQDDSAHGGKYTDTLLEDFISDKPCNIQLEVRALSADSGVVPPALKTRGVVGEKRVQEPLTRLSDRPRLVLYRQYRVEFVDAALALLGQHFPCDLFTQKSFKQVVEAHKGTELNFEYDWELISSAAPLLFFQLDPRHGASFYDLLIWYTRSKNGVFSFDHKSGKYKFSATKDGSAAPVELPITDLAAHSNVYGAMPRHKPRIVNSYAEGPRTQGLDNSNALTGIYWDHVIRTAIDKQVDDRASLEKARWIQSKRELELKFAQFPSVDVTPGQLLTLTADGGYAADLLQSQEAWRVYELQLSAEALSAGPEQDYGDKGRGFEMACSLRLETKSDIYARLPERPIPRFPGFIEGKILSEIDDDVSLTYQLDTDSDTSIKYYQVKIPLFANQLVRVPHEPYFMSGAIYVPLYKGERVLIAFQFDRAHVHKLLDWRGEAQVVADTQGQQVFLGKSPDSHTALLHDYQSGKPVFNLARKNASDTQFVQISEGNLTIHVEELESS